MEAWLYNCDAEFANRIPSLPSEHGFAIQPWNNGFPLLYGASGEIIHFDGVVRQDNARVTVAIDKIDDPFWHANGPGDSRLMLIPQLTMIDRIVRTKRHHVLLTRIENILLAQGGAAILPLSPMSLSSR